MKPVQKVAVMGMGYVGLTLSVVLAKNGFTVYGIEINKNVVKDLKKGTPHFKEKGLPALLEHQQKTERLHICESLPDERIDAYIISVGTPLNHETKEPNIDYIKNVVRDVANHMCKSALVALRSTVPVGLSREDVIPRLEEVSGLKAGKDFSFVFAPERTAEGKALVELEENPQIIGGINEQSVSVAADMFRRITPTILCVSSVEAAEMIKIMDNSYRDIRFAYANELALICERLGLDTHELVQAANTHYPRNSIPVPSPGVGGACLSKDPHIFRYFAKQKGYDANLIKAGRDINEYMPKQIVERIRSSLSRVGKDIEDCKIFVVGFAFKGQPETSDLRDSTTLWFTDALQKEVSTIYGYDPVVPGDELEQHGITVCSLKEGFENADVVLFMNNHKSYVDLDPYDICASMNRPGILYDAWRMFSKEAFEEIDNILYMGVGL